ncbi:MAG: RNA methyltransferase [Coriobacteriia bacterium]|nr:RNA methyltransferase [Coriobacteriia bacterium]
MPIINVTDIADPRLRMYSHQREVLLLDWPGYERGLFIGESANVIDRAMDSGIAPISFFLEEKWLPKTMPQIQKAWTLDPDIPVFTATREQFRAITTYEVTRGALAAFHRPPLPDVRDLLAGARRVAVLEDVTNYTNIGAIFRSAAALGIDAVLVTPSCHDPYYRRAARVSMGTVFQVPWTRIGTTQDWAAEGVPLLHELGFEVVALALSEDAIPLDEPTLKQSEKLALVLGTEGDGLAASTIAACDRTVIIPMEHGVDSLNVAAASAVAFWQLRR